MRAGARRWRRTTERGGGGGGRGRHVSRACGELARVRATSVQPDELVDMPPPPPEHVTVVGAVRSAGYDPPYWLLVEVHKPPWVRTQA